MTSEIDDYDEDVILPNSPLSEYLHNFGEHEDNGSKSANVSDAKLFQNSADSKNMLLYFCAVLKYIKYISNNICNFFIPSLIPFEYSILKNILDAYELHKILISEDLSFLQSFESEDEIKGEICISCVSVYRKFYHLLGLIMLCMCIRSLIIYFDIGNDFPIHDKFEIFIWIFSLSFYIIISLLVVFIFGNVIELCYYKFLCHSIKIKLRNSKKTSSVLKKSLRLIQEAELIARGFTSASVLGVVERLELSTSLPITSPERQYPELRKFFYLSTREMFMIYRTATIELIENIKVNSEFDFSSQAFAMLELKEFGNLLSYDVNIDTNLQELLMFTDGLSVSCLKTMCHLVELQVSEFYKFLYIKTSFLISNNLYNFLIKIGILYYFNSCIKNLETKEVCLKKKAYETYRYYRSFEMHSNYINKSLKLKSDASCLQTTVHNMSLHLKAALKRLIDIEELLETERKNNEKNEIFLKHIEIIINEVSSEVSAYHECYVKCYNKLQTVLYSETHCNISPCLEEPVNERDNQKSVVITKCDDSLPIEDEIFEAIVKESPLGNEDGCDLCSIEEQKQNAEVTGKLMNELKNVLLIKADEHRIREERALAKKFQKEGILSDGEAKNKKDHDISETENTAKELNKAATETSLPYIEISESTPRSSENETNITCASSSSGNDQNSFETKSTSFAASVAALALQRQKKLGISNDICFSSGEDSDDEIIS